MNCVYSTPCFCSDSNDVLNNFPCVVCVWFQYLYINSEDKVNCIKTPIKNLLKCVSGYLVSFYSYLGLKTVFSVLKLTQICYKNLKVSSLKTGNLITN